MGKCKECRCATNPICVSHGETPCTLPGADRVAAVVATPESLEGDRFQKEKPHDMKVKNNRTYSLHARLNAEEKARVEALMEIGGYTSFSVYIRDIILQKRLPYRQETVHVSHKQLSDKINVLVYQVNKIGINYNQVVATWQKQSHQTRPDGSPYMNTRVIEARLTELMRMTEGLRDEFAVILDVVKKYIGESPDTSTI